MTKSIEVSYYQTLPRKVDIVLLTRENITTVAKWMECSKVEIHDDLDANESFVMFYTARNDEKSAEKWKYLTKVKTGWFVARLHQWVNQNGDMLPVSYIPISPVDIQYLMPRDSEILSDFSPPYDN